MKFLASVILFVATATLSHGHCWPCKSDGTDYFKNVGECMTCCEALKFDVFGDKDGANPPFRGAGSIQAHREHCKEKHCKDWAKDVQGSCAMDDGQGGTTGWCPSDHRCECAGVGPSGCVYSGDWAATGGCRKAKCPVP